MSQPRLTIVPCELAEANAFVSRHHRHHQPIHRCKFNLAVVDEEGTVHGVAMVGRPVSLVAADWKLIGEAGGGSWHREGRPRVDTHPTGPKQLWEAV